MNIYKSISSFALSVVMTLNAISANAQEASLSYTYSAVDEAMMAEQLLTDYTSSLNLQCVDFQVLGVCAWLHITMFSVSIRFSPIISNYSPDAKVEVYHSKNNTPYLPAKLNHVVSNVVGDTIGSAAFGFALNNLSSSTEGFRSAHVMGNPTLPIHAETMSALFNALNLGYCGSNVVPFQTYFHSDIDAVEWRSGIMETVLYPVNILRQVRDGLKTWGGLYPRTGWTINSSPYIGASLAALRAGAIANANLYDVNGLHVTAPLPPLLRGGKQLSPLLVDENNGKWQPMNIGTPYQLLCTKFPTPTVSVAEPFKPSRSYYYTLWRKGHCCKRRGKFIGIL